MHGPSANTRTSPPNGQAPVVLLLGADAAYMVNFRAPLIRKLQAHGYQTVVAASPLNGFDPQVFETLNTAFYPWAVRKAGVDPLADLRAAADLWSILGRVKPTILFAHTIKPVIYGAMVGWARRVPRRVLMVPGLGHAFMPVKSPKQGLVRAVASLGYKAAFARADRVIFHNEDDIADLRARGIVGPKVKAARVFGSGVDLARFAPVPVPAGPPHFLMVARLLKENGVYEFVAAARQVKRMVPSARFTLVGAADTNPSAVSPEEVAAWKAEGVVEIVGFVNDPRPYFEACTVFVLPSYREGLPRTNLEAMAIGRALITSDAPGCRETVEPGRNGLLVPLRNPEALAAAMLEMAKDRDRVVAMGAHSRALCEARFGLEAVTAHTAALVLEG